MFSVVRGVQCVVFWCLLFVVVRRASVVRCFRFVVYGVYDV